jgi:hypothetical protein
VSTLPVTVSRLVRSSSLVSMRQQPLSRSITGAYDVALPYETEPLSSTSQSWVRWELVGSRTSRDFPTQGLADQRGDLALAGPCPLQGHVQRRHLGVASYEPGQPPRGGLEARPGRPRPEQLEHLDRLGQPIDRQRPERPHLDVALHQRERLGRQRRGVRLRKLLHPGGEVDRLAHGREVHVEIIADGPHDHLASAQPDPDRQHRPVSRRTCSACRRTASSIASAA